MDVVLSGQCDNDGHGFVRAMGQWWTWLCQGNGTVECGTRFCQGNGTVVDEVL